MGARSLSYARSCLASLIRNGAEPIRLVIITDGPDNVSAIDEALKSIDPERESLWEVHGKAEADRRAEAYFADYPAIREFRNGHPCWRKVTDPALFSAPGAEMIIIDPDVYFPNRFAFEPTPETGILLMWQRPNCLLPEDVVRTAFEAGVTMADHTDIGVCQTRAVDWDYLEEMLGQIGGANLPAHSMHVESIVWAALALKQGGAHLNPEAWRCFDNGLASRLARKAGKSGVAVLKDIDLSTAKCLHAGGVAKTWLVDAEKAGLFSQPRDLSAKSDGRGYEIYPRAKFERKFRIRRLAGRLGFYKLMGG
ncbi:hypothetical protein [Sphingobium boeckii]|uniref:Uncharacterized protein n=1 Tax=Sphingobium boeckii TaxID=1082345 RepID=A0A7W9AL41_9SPHN|nr:hypothetical protein [Sphingobium boeckii]MBB5687447.1 hypothetical protein [Sphingobium boeckii]